MGHIGHVALTDEAAGNGNSQTVRPAGLTSHQTHNLVTQPNSIGLYSAPDVDHAKRIR
jgi:hypothetical protein